VAAVIGPWTERRAPEPRFEVELRAGQQIRGAQLGAPEMRLSLQDAVALALAHNINLEVSGWDLRRPGRGSWEHRNLRPVISSSLAPRILRAPPPTPSWARRSGFTRTGVRSLPGGAGAHRRHVLSRMDQLA